jgi:hypothetical protein
LKNRGSIVLSLLLILTLTALSAALLVGSVNENKAANRVSNSTEAFWVAEAGLQKTLWEITDNSCRGMVQQGTAIACTSCTSCGGGNKTMAGSLTSSCDYDVVLNAANTLATSTGSCPNRTSTKMIVRNVRGVVGVQSPFSFAAFAQGQVDLANNTFIDSYDSNDGAYSVLNSSTNGDVGSNGTAAGIITIGNNISLGGDVSTGPGGTAVVGSNSDIYGSQSHSNDVNLTAVTVPTELTSMASGGALTVPLNATTTLVAGDYKYSSVNMNNNTTLNVTGGNVRLYLTGANAMTATNNVNITVATGATLQIFVDGMLDINNNVVLTSAENKAKNIQIYSTYTGANGVVVNNNGVLSAAIYAPQTDVSIGNNNDLFGSVIGETVTVNNNSAIHYDESLQTLATPAGPTGITSWTEI